MYYTSVLKQHKLRTNLRVEEDMSMLQEPGSSTACEYEVTYFKFRDDPPL